MLKRILLLFCVSLIFSQVATEGQENVSSAVSTVATTEAPKKVPRRIVNGTEARLGQFPQLVSLRRSISQNHFCGGSILTSKWILTAGHCMFDKYNQKLEPYTILVVSGEIILKNIAKSRQWSHVKQLIVHPSFDILTLENDVALLELKTPFTFDEYVMPARITSSKMLPGTKCQVAGWGHEKFNGSVSSKLMYIIVPLIPIPECRELLANYTLVPPGMFCAGYREGGKDACQGDSGGGLICKGLLTGVVSGGEGCAWPNLPGLYADAWFYLPWIRRHVPDLEANITVRRSATNEATSSASLFSLLAAASFITSRYL